MLGEDHEDDEDDDDDDDDDGIDDEDDESDSEEDLVFEEIGDEENEAIDGSSMVNLVLGGNGNNFSRDRRNRFREIANQDRNDDLLSNL